MKFTAADLADVPQEELDGEYVSARKLVAQAEKEERKTNKVNKVISISPESILHSFSKESSIQIEESAAKSNARFLISESNHVNAAAITFKRKAHELSMRANLENNPELSNKSQMYSLMATLSTILSEELLLEAIDSFTDKLESIYKRYGKK